MKVQAAAVRTLKGKVAVGGCLRQKETLAFKVLKELQAKYSHVEFVASETMC